MNWYWVIQTVLGKERQGVYGEVDYKTYILNGVGKDIVAIYKGTQSQTDLLLLLKDGHIDEKVKKVEMNKVLDQMEKIQ